VRCREPPLWATTGWEQLQQILDKARASAGAYAVVQFDGHEIIAPLSRSLAERASRARSASNVWPLPRGPALQETKQLSFRAAFCR
jgi:hypothetical protein